MKRYLLLILLLKSVCSFGQFAVISDKDGSVNVRADGQSNSKIIDKLENGHLVFCGDSSGNWTRIDYKQRGKDLVGYIYKDRYRFVSSFLAIPIALKEKDRIIFKRDSFEIILTQRKFDKGEHTFKYSKESPNQIELVDDKKYWGEDGGMPTRQFDRISIKMGQKNLVLPKIALEGLYQPNLNNAKANFDSKNNVIYIYSSNSDGAGAYEVIWTIENEFYRDRFIAYGF